MKTPLPEKLDGYVPYVESMGNRPLEETMMTVNQLIDVVAEVVEGKLWVKNAEEFLAPLNPTLKETLLDDIRGLFRYCDEREDRVEISDVEAIINRLMP